MTDVVSAMYFYDVNEDIPYKYIEQDKETGDIYLFGQRVYLRRPVVIMLNPSTSGWTTILDDHNTDLSVSPRKRIRMMEIRLCVNERNNNLSDFRNIDFKLRLFNDNTHYFSEQVLKRVSLKRSILSTPDLILPIYFTKVVYFGENTPPIYGYSLIVEALTSPTYYTVGCSIRLWEQYY